MLPMILQFYYNALNDITISLLYYHNLPWDLMKTLSLKVVALYTSPVGHCPRNCNKNNSY
jgi:hypothetical protein